MLPRHSLLVAFALLVLSLTQVHAAPRQWTSSDGKFKVDAELVSFDGRVVSLKKTDGTKIEVPLEKLSEADRKFLAEGKDAVKPADPVLPASVVKFRSAMDKTRKAEAERLEKRLKELQEQLRAGSKDVNHRVGQEAKALQRSLAQRLKVVKSDDPYLPRLSPKDFEVGQIGEFDDDLAFTTSRIEKDGSAYVSIVFDAIRYKEKLPKLPVGWHHTTVSRPDVFHLRAEFAAGLPLARDFDRNSPTNRLLRSHVYEIVGKEPRGLATDYVLAPFKMDEVLAWMKAGGKK